MEWLTANFQNIMVLLVALYALARTIVVLTPTPKDNEALEEVSIVLKVIAKAFGLDLTQGINTTTKPTTPTGTIGLVLMLLLIFLIACRLRGMAEAYRSGKGAGDLRRCNEPV